MKTICHLTSAHPRFDTRIFIKECSSLAEKYDTYLIVADGAGTEEKNNVTIIDAGRFPGRLNRMINAPKAIYHLAKKIDADLYHLHDPELIPIGLKLKLLGKKVIFDAHEDLPNQVRNKHYIPKPIQLVLPHLVTFFEKHTCDKFDAIVVAAEPVIKDKFLNINPLTIVINNFPIIEELTLLSNHNKSTNQICYVGGLSEIRGIVELINSLEYSRNSLRLVLAGNFDNKEFESKVKLLNQWSNVDFMGYVDRQNIANILENSRIGMVTLHPTPSYLNSMPVKLFEYMAAGIPVVASDFPLWRSIVDSVKCGICIDPLKPIEIAAAVDYLIENPQEAMEMGNKGREAVINLYNWTVEKNKLFMLYAEVLGKDDD